MTITIKKTTKEKFTKYLVNNGFLVQEMNDPVILFSKNLLVGAISGVAILGKGEYTVTQKKILGTRQITKTNDDKNKTKIFFNTGLSSLGLVILILQFIIFIWVLGLGIITTIILWILFPATANQEMEKTALMLQKEFI